MSKSTLKPLKFSEAFYVCQACISAIGWKSRIRFTVRSISQEQGCRG
jgi:hypothetical protein